MEYLDFELEIGPGIGLEYPVAVISSPAGPANEAMHFPFDDLALENRLQALKIALLQSGGKRRTALSKEEENVQGFGRDLFNALLPGEIRNRYEVSRERAFRDGKGLRLKLRIRPPKLAALPWEFLYEPGHAKYMCLSRHTPVVRYLEIPSRQILTLKPPLRILGMFASPSNLPPLDGEREKQRVEKALENLKSDGLVELEWLQGQTWRELMEAMRKGPWHIFHFIGHGGFDRNSDEGLIYLADEMGKSQPFRATYLGSLLSDHDSLRLILLNSCEGATGSECDIFSSTASILVRSGIPAVLAMQYEITDKAAIEFARTFYEALADGLPVDAAVAEARKAIYYAVTNSVEWGTPVLYMHSPDGVLFSIQKEKTEGRKQEKAAVTPEFDHKAWHKKGLALYGLTKYDEAISYFDKAIEIDPKYADAWRNKGRALYYLGKYEEALSCFDRAIEIDPKYVDAWRNKGAALCALKKYEEALSCYDKAMELDPRLVDTWSDKGAALCALKKYEEAHSCYDKAIELDPKYADAWYGKGLVLHALNKDYKARLSLEEYIKLASPQATVQIEYAKKLIKGRRSTFRKISGMKRG